MHQCGIPAPAASAFLCVSRSRSDHNRLCRMRLLSRMCSCSPACRARAEQVLKARSSSRSPLFALRFSGVAAWQRGNIAPRRRLSAQPPLVRQIDKLKSLWSRENVQEECAPREYATGSSRYKSSLSIFTSRTTGPPCDRAIPYVRSRPCEFSSLEREFLAVWRTMALQC
jgi:hypothetical protein